MIKEYLHIDWNLFHFLRPEWLWLFIPMAIIALLTFMKSSSAQQWQKKIAPHLRPFIINKGSRFAQLGPIVLFIIITSLMVISAAGPTWKKVEVPGSKSEAILLIALDLSQSMIVEDISPNRLERAKFMVKDLLEAKPGARVGLMVYAGTAHTVVIPSMDYDMVAYQMENLQPSIMPLQGTKLKNALSLADTLLNQTEAPSTLLLISDDINSTQASELKKFAQSNHHKIELLSLATLQGGKIPNPSGGYFKKDGKYVISKLEQNILFELQKEKNIHVNTMSFDKENMIAIAEKVRENLEFRSKDEEKEEEWQEMGYVLVWLIVIFFVLWFRKGWMIQYSILLFFFSSCTSVDSWDDLWYSKDYQAQKKMNNEDYSEAASQFESLNHKGIAFYKAGDFESAIEVFKQDSSSTSLYNLGLAFAASGQNDLAQQALSLAQEKDPNNSNIQESLKNNEQKIMTVDSLRISNPEEAKKLEESDQPKEKLEERRAKGKDEELTSDTEVKELPKDGKRVTDEQETGMRKAKELEKVPDDFKAGDGENAQNVLLREISADPSEFLRRRFKFQYEKYYSQEQEAIDPW